jgi:guanylate cyclase
MLDATERYAFAARAMALVERISADPSDTNELRIQKTLMVTLASLIATAALIWTVIYWTFQEYLAAWIPLSYAVISSISIIHFTVARRYGLFRFSQLLLILVLPFILMIRLGGFVNSSVVVLWALLAPLGALFFSDPRRARWWFMAYIALVVTSGFLQPLLRSSNNLSSQVILIFFVMNLGVVSSIAFVVLYYFVSKNRDYLNLLHIEQDKSERLLLNILPRDIAEKLKNESGIIADQFDEASILFADLVGFTLLSTELEPVEMVELLNEIYSHFDDLVDKYELEKIRTIGDNYMVVSGVPRPRKDHAHALAGMSLEMEEYLEGFAAGSGRPIQCRIGINSGPVLAGVVGRRKFQYDVWGDSVNVASRMESHGVPSKIHITDVTRKLIDEDFACVRRGTVEVKGKGQMETWFLVGRKPAAPST